MHHWNCWKECVNKTLNITTEWPWLKSQLHFHCCFIGVPTNLYVYGWIQHQWIVRLFHNILETPIDNMIRTAWYSPNLAYVSLPCSSFWGLVFLLPSINQFDSLDGLLQCIIGHVYDGTSRKIEFCPRDFQIWEPRGIYAESTRNLRGIPRKFF